MSHLKRPILSLKEFMLRRQVLKLYKELLQCVQEIPLESDRKQLKDWIRSDFKSNKHHTDELAIKSLIKYGERSLKELRQNIELSKNGTYVRPGLYQH